MMSRRKIAAILAMLMAFTLLTACSESNEPSNSGNTAPATTAAATTAAATTATSSEPATTDSGKDTVVTFLNGDIATLDPRNISLINESAVACNVFDVLVFVDKNHNEHMYLAESYTISEDGLVYTFKIREGVYFHNGEELKASDVAFSFNRNSDSPYRGAQMEQVASSRAIDDYTFELTLLTPYAPCMELTVSGTFIVNEKAVTEAEGDMGMKPIGTGPYVFISHETNSQVKLTRYDDYYRGPARIKNVDFKIIVDTNTSAIALQTGEIHFGGFNAAAYANISADPKLVVEVPTTAHITYLMMNHEVAPLDNVLVRQAINYAIDRDFIVEAGMGGFARVAGNIISPDVMGYTDAVKEYTYDKEKAIELLAQAGVTTPIDLGVLKTIDGGFKTAAQLIQANLSDIGITVTVEVFEATKYIEDCHKGDFTLGMMGMSCGNDAEGFCVMLTSEYINGFNMARYNNPTFDALMAQGRSSVERSDRERIYTEAFNISYDDAVYAPLYNQNRLFAYSVDLQVDYYDVFNFMAYELAWK